MNLTAARPAATAMARVLLVEDSPDHRALMARRLEHAGFAVVAVATGEEALAHLTSVEVVLVDQRLPQMSGLDLLRRIGTVEGGPAAVVVTSVGSPELVVGAMRLGAVDYVAKTSDYLDELPAVVERAFRQRDLARRNRELQRFALLVHEPVARPEALYEIVTSSRRLLRASGVCLALRTDGHTWSIAATDGDVGRPERVLLGLTDTPEAAEPVGDGVLVVPLPVDPDEPAGVLVARRSPDQPFAAEEQVLATTFAAFAASALRQVRRLELERGLIDQLERSIRARQDFVASISHELRTPLTSIGGYTETLLAHREQLAPDMVEDLLGRIRHNASALGRLVDQLLDVAGLERGRAPAPTIDSVELEPAVRAVLGDMSFHLAGRTVSCRIPPVVVRADRELLARTVMNLVSNAAKYSSSGSPVEVSATVGDRDVRVAVRDEGVGIEPADAARVFEPFWRAGYAVGQAVRGTGIGLSLVHEYVRSMGGDVGVDSRPDEGSTFWFTLPRD